MKEKDIYLFLVFLVVVVAFYVLAKMPRYIITYSADCPIPFICQPISQTNGGK